MLPFSLVGETTTTTKSMLSTICRRSQVRKSWTSGGGIPHQDHVEGGPPVNRPWQGSISHLQAVEPTLYCVGGQEEVQVTVGAADMALAVGVQPFTIDVHDIRRMLESKQYAIFEAAEAIGGAEAEGCGES